MVLSQEIESLEGVCPPDQLKIISLKYENLILDVNFEDCPSYIKKIVSLSFSSNNRFILIQLNGIIGQHNRVRSNAELEVFKSKNHLLTPHMCNVAFFNK